MGAIVTPSKLLSATATPKLIVGTQVASWKGWAPTFVDDFIGGANLLPDTSTTWDGGWWARYNSTEDYTQPVVDTQGVAVGGWSTMPGGGELEAYLDPASNPLFTNPVFDPFSGGPSSCIITARQTSAQTTGNATLDSEFNQAVTLPYTSGVICSYLYTGACGFSQLYGYFEIRAKLPAGVGPWPAFWLLRTDNSWPPEIDVFERFPADPTTTIRCTTHTRVNTTGYSDLGALGYEVGDHYQDSTVVNCGFDTSAGFHTYGVEWTPTTMTYYVDRIQVAQHTTPTDMDKPMYLLANCAVDWQHNISSFPATYTIDWVRAWSYPSA